MLLLAAAPVRAQSAILVESDSLLIGRRFGPVFVPEAEAERCRQNADLSPYCRRLLVPFYEYLTLRADNLGVPGLSVEFSGWGVADLDNRFDPTRAGRVPHRDNDAFVQGVGGDIMVGTVTYRAMKNRLELRLGRQFLFLGAPYATNFDGLYAAYHLPYDIDVAVYGGGATPRDAFAGRDSWNPLVGGRVGWSRLDLGSAGVSILSEANSDGDPARRQLGVDAAVFLPKRVDLAGTVLWDWDEFTEEKLRRIEHAEVIATWLPIPRLKLAADYTYVVPSGLIPKTSIFSIFSDSTYQDAGIDLYYRLTPQLRLSGLFRYRAFSVDDNGLLAGVGVRYLLGEHMRQVVGLDFQRLDTKDTDLQNSGYYQLRVYGSVTPLPRLFLSGDFFYFRFDNLLYQNVDVKNAGALSATAMYRITPTMDALVSLTANFNPASKDEVILLGRFVWHTWLDAGARRIDQ